MQVTCWFQKSLPVSRPTIESLKPGFHIIASVATVATVAIKIIQRQERLERWERFLGFHIIATIATKMANDRVY